MIVRSGLFGYFVGMGGRFVLCKRTAYLSYMTINRTYDTPNNRPTTPIDPTPLTHSPLISAPRPKPTPHTYKALIRTPLHMAHPVPCRPHTCITRHHNSQTPPDTKRTLTHEYRHRPLHRPQRRRLRSVPAPRAPDSVTGRTSSVAVLTRPLFLASIRKDFRVRRDDCVVETSGCRGHCGVDISCVVKVWRWPRDGVADHGFFLSPQH
jgi:hypothetical protein